MNKRNGILLLGIAIGLVVAALVAGILVVGRRGVTPAPAFPSPAIMLTPPPSLQDLATRYPQLAGLLSDPELDSAYKDFMIAYQQGGLDAAAELARKRGILTPQNELRATLILDTPDNAQVVSQLESIGVIVEAAYETQVDIAVPLTLIQQVADAGDPGAIFSQLTALRHVIRVRLPGKMRPDSYSMSPLFVTGQGVHMIGADAWHQAGFTGKNVKVGILDCGFRGYKNLLGIELPASVEARSFVRGLSDPSDADSAHGTAVAEVIHDIAPDAVLYLADYGCSGAPEGKAVEWLLGQGVKIISHSAGSPAAPMDGTGWGAKLVQKAVAKDVLWINSAGNEAETHYRGAFSDTDDDGFHEFKAGHETMAFRSGEAFIEIVLRWDDWESADQDFDLVLLDGNGYELAWSRNTQSGAPGDEPLEYLEYYGLSAGDAYYLAIYTAAATRAVTFDLILNGKDVVIEFPVSDYSLVTPADAREALAVGAVEWKTDRIADYSSRGPTADGRLKPDLSAPSGVESATYGRFGGTSAAAPHVAGAAALVWSVFTDFDRRQVWEYLAGNAVDKGPAGPDTAYGTGRLQLPEPPAVLPPTVIPGPTVARPITPIATPIVSTPVATSQPTPALPVSPTPSAIPVPSAWPTLTPTPTARSPMSPGLMIGGGAGLIGLAIITLAIVWTTRRRSQGMGLPQGPAPRAPLSPPPGYPQGPAPALSAQPMPTAPAPGQPYTPAQPAPPGYPPAPAPPPVRPQASVLTCPHCGKAVRAGARFCAACGKPTLPQAPAPAALQAQRCQKCGQELRAGARFCARCGTKQ